MSADSVDREFAEKFYRSVDRPFEYGVYVLFHDWWAEAPQSAIDGYAAELAGIPGSEEFLGARYLPNPFTVDRLGECEPGTLGHYYRDFIVQNGLEANLARNYRDFNTELRKSGCAASRSTIRSTS